jgi:hypothetical protein
VGAHTALHFHVKRYVNRHRYATASPPTPPLPKYFLSGPYRTQHPPGAGHLSPAAGRVTKKPHTSSYFLLWMG